ncbi:MAG: hypothetical protein PHC33_02280 [Candidatus Omnitrophica bacterium]|nr:hypothetical protein [Candidatus Omnitrophota bacterium]
MEPRLNENRTTARDLLKVIFKRKFVILSAVCIVMSVLSIVTQLQSPEIYEAKVKMLISAKKNIESPYYKNITDTRSMETTLTQSELVKSNPVIERVVKVLKLNEIPLDYEKKMSSPLHALLIDWKNKKIAVKSGKMSEKEKNEFLFQMTALELKKKIRIDPIKDTDLFTITVTDYDAKQSARLANTISRSYCIFDLEQQLAELQQRYGDKHLFVLQLKDNLRKLEDNLTIEKISNIEALGPASVKIIEQAVVPIEPVKEHTKLVFIFAFFVSIFLGITLAFSCEYMDTTFKSPFEIKEELGKTVVFLGDIPAPRAPISAKILIGFHSLIHTLLGTVAVFILARVLVNVLSNDIANPLVMFFNPAWTKSKTLFPFIIIITLAIAVIFLDKAVIYTVNRLIRNVLFGKKSRPENPYQQACRTVASHIGHILKEKDIKSAVIAPVPASGENSAVTANLAYLAAGKNANILLIDAGLNNAASLHKVFALSASPGLTEALSGNAPLDNAMRKIQPNFSLLPAGGRAVDTGELIDSPQMSELIKNTEKKFDHVFIYFPDLKKLKETRALASFTRGIILMAGEGITRKEVFKALIEPLQQNGTNIIGVVYNNRTYPIPKVLYKRT